MGAECQSNITLSQAEINAIHDAIATWKTTKKILGWGVATVVGLAGYGFLWGIGIQNSVNRHDLRLDLVERSDALMKDEWRDTIRNMQQDIAGLRSDMAAVREAVAAHVGGFTPRLPYPNGNGNGNGRNGK